MLQESSKRNFRNVRINMYFAQARNQPNFGGRNITALGNLFAFYGKKL